MNLTKNSSSEARMPESESGRLNQRAARTVNNEAFDECSFTNVCPYTIIGEAPRKPFHILRQMVLNSFNRIR